MTATCTADLAAMLAAVDADPTDRTRWLVLADALDEADRPDEAADVRAGEAEATGDGVVYCCRPTLGKMAWHFDGYTTERASYDQASNLRVVWLAEHAAGCATLGTRADAVAHIERHAAESRQRAADVLSAEAAADSRDRYQVQSWDGTRAGPVCRTAAAAQRCDLWRSWSSRDRFADPVLLVRFVNGWRRVESAMSVGAISYGRSQRGVGPLAPTEAAA